MTKLNIDKINQLNLELGKLDSITKRLDHYKINYLDKYPDLALAGFFETKTKDELGAEMNDCFSQDICGPICGITGNFLCPLLEKPYYEHKNLGEYNYWMLFYKAERLFNVKNLFVDIIVLGAEVLNHL